MSDLQAFTRAATDAAIEAFLAALRENGLSPFPEQADALRRLCNAEWKAGYSEKECGHD